jgi:hypothetical protein
MCLFIGVFVALPSDAAAQAKSSATQRVTFAVYRISPQHAGAIEHASDNKKVTVSANESSAVELHQTASSTSLMESHSILPIRRSTLKHAVTSASIFSRPNKSSSWMVITITE